MTKPIIAVPMGDPAGIGAEIIVKALASGPVQETAGCVVIGDKSVIGQALRIADVKLQIHVISKPGEGVFTPGILNLIDLRKVEMKDFTYGKVSAMCGRAAYAYIEESIRLAMSKEVDAVATAPINKESLKAGQIPYIGHTEIFADLTKTSDPLTLFETNGMRIFFLTRHLSLREMLGQIKKERVEEYVVRCQAALDLLGVEKGTLAVAGLNPHCGEHGLFGTEEMEEIMPAVNELKQKGYTVEGPIGADSVFHQAAMGKYRAVLSLYHDQGHIAAKTLDFEKTISITVGMPILRTSVDHGTAFDVAGTGKASERSMCEAIRLAAKYAEKFQGKGEQVCWKN